MAFKRLKKAPFIKKQSGTGRILQKGAGKYNFFVKTSYILEIEPRKIFVEGIKFDL